MDFGGAAGGGGMDIMSWYVLLRVGTPALFL